MFTDKSQYLNLTSGSDEFTDNVERKYTPETRTVFLAGRLRKLFEDQKRGIPILESGRQKRTPLLDLKRFLKLLLYGLSAGLVVTGGFLLFDKKDGE